MLRQLSMTQNFYQINYSFSLVNSSQIHHYQNFQNTQSLIALDIKTSNFILFPYVSPKYPYCMPPSAPEPRHIRQKESYNDLKQLDANQTSDFLHSYQAYKYGFCAKKNPTNTTNPFYQWVIKHNLNAWRIRKTIIDNYKYEDSFETPPLWSQARMEQSRTVLADGRIVLIGGEYEDFYDPDFCIYNDVIVINVDGTSEIYSYPKSLFAPTDFHTATLVSTEEDEHIIIIGSLGYPEDRQYAHTSVYRLNVRNFKIEQVATRNSMGWISSHQATLRDNQIVIKGGEILIDDIAPLLDNLDTWTLNLNTLIWKNITQFDRKWQRFYVRRQDDNGLSLWEYKQLDGFLQKKDHLQTDITDKSQSKIGYISDEIQKYSADIEDYTNQSPNIEVYRQLLVPPIAHEIVSIFDDSEELNSYDSVLLIDDIKVGYKTRNDSCIQVIIEGKLSDDKLELLQQNLRHKLSKIENMACEVVEI